MAVQGNENHTTVCLDETDLSAKSIDNYGLTCLVLLLGSKKNKHQGSHVSLLKGKQLYVPFVVALVWVVIYGEQPYRLKSPSSPSSSSPEFLPDDRSVARNQKKPFPEEKKIYIEPVLNEKKRIETGRRL